MFYICAEFREIISNGIKVKEWTRFLYGKLQRGIILYISTKFCEIISDGIKVIERTRFLFGKLRRGIIPQKM